MENTDFKQYTVKGLQKMAKDAGIKKMSKATAGPLCDALAEVDLSKLDMGSYEMKKVDEVKEDEILEAPKPLKNSIASKATSPRRTIRKSSFGRR